MILFLDNSSLNKITSLLRNFDASDRFFDAKLELVSYTKTDHSHIGVDIHNDEPEDILSHFIAIMNKCYPDYNFNDTSKTFFKEVKTLDVLVKAVYYDLSFIVGRSLPEFTDEFWRTIKQIMPLKDADIYTYDSLGKDDPYNSESCLNSFNYFLVDKKQRYILFLSCITRTRCSLLRDKNDDDPLSFQPSIYSEPINSTNDEDCLSEVDIPETCY